MGLDAAKVKAILGQLAKELPETVERVGDIISRVSDNHLKLKLEVMRQNLAIYRSKLEISRLLLESDHELGAEMLRDVAEMQNRLVEINYDLAEVVSSTARSSAVEKVVDGITSFIKKYPEVVALPFGPPAAGGVWLTKRLLGAAKASTTSPQRAGQRSGDGETKEGEDT